MSSSIISKSDRAFIEQAAKESQRVDGRRLLDHRRVRIHFHVQPGMVEVQLGTCRVLGVVSAALVVPPAERPAEGIVSLDLLPLPLADSSTDANRASETMKDGRAILQRAIVKSRCVDVESLCVIAGKAVWKVTVELKVLENGGNVTDCCSLAAVLSLNHFKLNEVIVDGDKVKVFAYSERIPRSLTLHHIPMCVSFGLFLLPEKENSSKGDTLVIIADPSKLEEQVMHGQLVIIAGSKDRSMLYGISKTGGAPLPPSQLQRCCEMAIDRAAELHEVCKEALRKNEEKTKKRDMDALRKIKRADVEEVEVEEEGESKEKEEKGEEGEAEKEAKKLKTET